MEKVEEIISDDQLDVVFENANFGSTSKRDVISNGLLKCASSYYTGNTAKCILEELGLVTTKWTLTKLGKRYLFIAFYNGHSI